MNFILVTLYFEAQDLKPAKYLTQMVLEKLVKPLKKSTSKNNNLKEK